MIPITASETEQLRQSDMKGTMIYALAFGALIIVLTIAAFVFGVATGLVWTAQVTAMVFILGGVAVGVILLTGLRRGRRVVFMVVAVAEQILEDYKQAKIAAPTDRAEEDSALPAQEREIPATVGGRAVEPVPYDEVHGFDPRDLKFLCRQIARGVPYTEKVMEKLELPYSRRVMGKAQGDTLYNRFMRLCGETEVIIERGGPGNAPGKLMVTDPDEIYRRIKALPEVLDEPNGQ